jgi:TonB family protein
MKRSVISAIAVLCVSCPTLLFAQVVSQGSTATRVRQASSVQQTTQDQKVAYDQPPEPTKQVTPKYPREASSKGIEGTVWTQVWIDAAGTVTKAAVTKSDAKVFDQPAIDAAMKWKFKPARKGGKPIAVSVTVPFRFKLSTDGETGGAASEEKGKGMKPAPTAEYDEAPVLIKQVNAKYPEGAKDEKIEGTVYLKVRIGETGEVTDVKVDKGVREDLDSAAKSAAMQWKFKPAMKNKKPVAIWVMIPFRFKITTD